MRYRPSKTVSVLLLGLLVVSAASVALGARVSTGSSLTVLITSPSSGSVFNRGQIATITATVSSGGSPVSGALVVANSPVGATIDLSETATPGTYSASYTVLATDPAEVWTINVQAIKSGQIASAQTVVSVSNLLKLTVLSPAPNAKFNIGEVVTAKATVTLQDGSPVAPSSSVSFSRPLGGASSMGVDPSDPSGRTWIGSYTVLASDVPADGFGWQMTLVALFDANTQSSIQSLVLFRSLMVGVSTFGSSAYGVPKDTFAKGETVFVKGVVDFQDGMVTSSGTVAFTISGTSIAATPASMVFNPSLNAWTGSYTLLSSDQAGSQGVTISAADTHGNTGSGVHQIVIVGATSGLSVSITSPSMGSVFNRGETVTISAQVTMGGSPVTGATVTARTPTGGMITLAPGVAGAYSAQYTVLSTDPVGTWTIAVVATQGGQTSTANVISSVSSSLKISIIAPPAGTELNIGQTATVKAIVTFQDGSSVPAVTSVSFNRPVSGVVVMSMNPSDPSHGTWLGSYSILASDVSIDGATWNIAVSASVGGNAGTSAPTGVKLFNSLNVLASTWSSSSFTVPKDTFVRGDTVFVEAQVYLRDGTVVSSGSVNFKITGTSIAGSPVAMTYSASLKGWVGSYTLLQSDATGDQIVSAAAQDASGSIGSGTHTIGIEVPVTTPQPLEAKITFDPQTGDLAVRAVCNAGCVSPTTVSMTSTTHHGNDHGEGDEDKGRVLRTYTISDSAGHKVILQVHVNNNGQNLKAQLLSIQYGNSAPIAVPNNEIRFASPGGDHGDNGDSGNGDLEQSISVNDVVSAEAHFDAQHNVTHIHIGTENGDDDSTGQNFTLNGFWLLELSTSNGSLGVGYFQAG